MPKVFRVSKIAVSKLCRKSIVLATGKRVRVRLVINDYRYWLCLR